MSDNNIKVIIIGGVFNVKTSFDFCIAVPGMLRDRCIPFVYINVIATPAGQEPETAAEKK
jgi:hypothetical protein